MPLGSPASHRMLTAVCWLNRNKYRLTRHQAWYNGLQMKHSMRAHAVEDDI